MRNLLIISTIVLSLIFVSNAGSSSTLEVLTTAYCLRGTTATGTEVSPGTIAVDPNVIPLYSRLYIPGYGDGKALDTGGDIQGYHIDLWLSSCQRAIQWGARERRITLLS